MNPLTHRKQTILAALVTIVLACLGFLPTIRPACIQDPCKDLEQKLSTLESKRDDLEDNINTAQGQLDTSKKNEARQDIIEYTEQLRQIEKKIETAQAALDQCKACLSTGSKSCPKGEEWPAQAAVCDIWADNVYRHIHGNGIPNHCVAVAESYHEPIAAQETYSFKVPMNPNDPGPSANPTPVTVCPTGGGIPQRFGVARNGIVFDPEDVAIWLKTAKVCGPDKEPVKNPDCIDNVPVSVGEDCSLRWQLNPGATLDPSWDPERMCCSDAALKLDDVVGHTQKGGRYHYHMVEAKTAAAIAGVRDTCLEGRMTLVGWAFDGFPIYWKYGQLKKGGEPITMESGWSPSKSARMMAATVGAGAPDFGRYPLGTFVKDYKYTAGKGDAALDQCNGKICYSPDLDKNIYCYFITEKFPYIPRYFRGTPNEK